MGVYVALTSRIVMRALIISSILLIVSVASANDKPANLTLHDLSGKKVRLQTYRGKVVVLNFWATWCGPCREEMPMMVDAEKAWAAKGVSFIAISLDDNKTVQNVPGFIAKYHVEFPVWTGASSNELDAFRLGDGVPDTVFLDEDGVIVARVLGEIHRAEVDERLSWLTGDRKGSQPPSLIDHMRDR